MKDETVVRLFRTGCGTVLLVVHALTEVNSLLVTVALVLMGVPFELLKRGASKDDLLQGQQAK